MNIEKKNPGLKKIPSMGNQHGENKKGTVKDSPSSVQVLSEKLFLLGERSPNYVLGYN